GAAVPAARSGGPVTAGASRPGDRMPSDGLPSRLRPPGEHGPAVDVAVVRLVETVGGAHSQPRRRQIEERQRRQPQLELEASERQPLAPAACALDAMALPERL